MLVAVPLFALAAFGAGDGTLLATVGGFMGFNRELAGATAGWAMGMKLP